LKAPEHLSKEAKAWWNVVHAEFNLSPHHAKLLQAACECWDRLTAARQVLDSLGPVYDDRWGCPHPRPEVGIERDCRIAFVRLVRELNLDGSVPPNPNTVLAHKRGG
jgi:phage terminase small subunit